MRRGLLLAGVAAAGLLLQACAAKPVLYGPIGPEVPHGYKDRVNADGSFTVLVAMPGHSTPADLRGFFDRRAGELCPGGVERTNVFRLHRGDYTTSGYVYGSVGMSSRVWVGTELEGYVYCKPHEAGPPVETSPATATAAAS